MVERNNNEKGILEKIVLVIIILTAIITPIVTLRERMIRLETKFDIMTTEIKDLHILMNSHIMNGQTMVLPDKKATEVR
ncbi:MAG: hypothetical protein MUP81_03385 [Dehalococcoidia bacterium]|nr:hypothetical protein [Dehalococcoidia bacterium]